MNYLQVKDWAKYQHYKDRNPPWIKLETDTFMKYEFGLLSDASKLLAVCIWTLASRYRDPKLGLVPADLDYIKRQCNLGDLIKIEHLKELINQGYIIDASNALADCKQSAIPETYSKEAETYSKEAKKNIDRFENFWDVYGYKVGREKAKIAYSRTIKQGVAHDEIIRGVIRYQQDCQARGVSGKYIKQPTTWLNGKHWQDEYPEYVETRKSTADDNCTAGILLALSEHAERQGH